MTSTWPSPSTCSIHPSKLRGRMPARVEARGLRGGSHPTSVTAAKPPGGIAKEDRHGAKQMGGADSGRRAGGSRHEWHGGIRTDGETGNRATSRANRTNDEKPGPGSAAKRQLVDGQAARVRLGLRRLQQSRQHADQASDQADQRQDDARAARQRRERK